MAAQERNLTSWMEGCGCAAFGPAGQRFVKKRPWFMVLIFASNLTLLFLAGYPQRRLATMVGILLLPLALAVISAFKVRRTELSPIALWTWLVLACGFITTALAATGGLRSPLMPIPVVPVIVTVAVFRWTTPARIILATFAASVLILLSLPPWVTGPAIPYPWFEAMIGVNLLLSVAFGCYTILALSEGFTLANRTLESVRERALEAAARRVRSLEQVSAKVAHELKNPLAAIKSLLQLESEGARAGGDERSQRRLEVMTREVARMEGIMRDYLSFSRPLEDLRLGAVDLAAVADNVVALLEGRAAATGVTIERKGKSLMLAGDVRRLEEAVLNLAANAIEATPRGGRVSLEIDRLDGAGVLRVRDTGKGMSAAVLEKLGTPFFTTRADGTGLGVVLARSVITQHGGQLEWKSLPGSGTTATVTLPPCMAASGAIAVGQINGPPAAG
jgi:signal transduction histidine kinase